MRAKLRGDLCAIGDDVQIGLSFALFIATSRQKPTMYDPVGCYIGGILMAASMALLLLQDLLVQETILWTAGAACAVTVGGRIAHIALRARSGWRQ